MSTGTASSSADAIVIRNVIKSFRKSSMRREYSTLKSELLRLLKGKRDKDGKSIIPALRGFSSPEAVAARTRPRPLGSCLTGPRHRSLPS